MLIYLAILIRVVVHMKKTFCILVALLLSFSLFAGGASENGVDNSLNDVLEKGQFVLGLDDSFPPMGYREVWNLFPSR